MLGNVITGSSGFGHPVLLKIPRQTQDSLDIAGLCTLVATSQQDDQITPTFLKIHSVPRPAVNPQFGHTLSNRLGVPRVSCCQAFNPDLNTRTRANVAQTVKPLGENLGLPNLNHYELYPRGYALSRSRAGLTAA